MSSTVADDGAAALDALLVRVADGDRDAFEEIYRRTSPRLFGICLRLLPARHAAEEALQEVYLSVWRRAETFDPARAGAMTWLTVLARNRAVDRLRADRGPAIGAIELAGEVVDPAPDPAARAEGVDDERRLGLCLDTLEKAEKTLIRAAFFEGSTYAELARRCSTPLGTMKSRIRRALLRLRDCMA